MSFRGNKVPGGFLSRSFKEAPINHFLQPRGSRERGCSRDKGLRPPLPAPLPGGESHCPLPSECGYLIRKSAPPCHTVI